MTKGLKTSPERGPARFVATSPTSKTRFLLDQATTTAGRHPNSDIFLDDITVSRRTPSSGA